MKQLLLTVDYIHSLQVVHRDIKPDNILYSAGSGILKLIDFGFSCYAVPYKIKYRCKMSPKGTALYIAPEIWDFYLKGSRQIKHNEDIEKLKKSDVWSLGISIYELIFGINPYEGLEFINDIAENVASDEPILFYEFEGDPFLIDVLATMLDKNYKERYSAREAYNLLLTKYPDFNS